MCEEQAISTEFTHRKSYSSRVFIGPWDIKAPQPPPKQDPTEELSFNQQDLENTSVRSSNKPLSQSSKASITPIREVSIATPSSEETSFMTAKSRPVSSLYQHTKSSYSIVQEEEEEEEIDYDMLISDTLLTKPTETMQENSDAESARTVRPSASKSDPTFDKKGKSPMRNLSLLKRKAKSSKTSAFSRKRKPLVWKKMGQQQVQTPISLKREPILCMRSVNGSVGTEPTRYKATKEAKFDLLAEKWRQVELVLTSTCISTFSASTLFWPKYRLEHRVYLTGPKRPRQLELFLMSPLDYTFGLRYISAMKSVPMAVTLTFKARSFLKCQEWYMQLYNMLPLECKRPPPQWCEVYIPMLDLTVNLPLAHLQDSSSITLEEAKEAVVDILKEEQEESLEKITAKSSQALDDFGFCWTTGDRAEWIYWTHSATHQPMNSVICPQNIEKTHRLELRPIEHTPNHIVLPDNFVLKEPPPVEGFLIHITDFTGSNKTKKNRKMRYFASFDQYLFYTPVQKTTVPNMRCFIDEGLLPKNARSQPYVSAISPYAPACTPEIQAGEITRRMLLMTEAKGVIDLTQVSYVRRTFIDNPMTNFEESGISNHSRIALLNKQSSIPSYQAVSQQDSRKACLELVMENGLQIKFEAYSSDTCDLWVNYLAQIVVYWKARKEAVKDVHSYDNFIFNHAKSLVNTKDGCAHHQNQRLADTRIWSLCLYEQCRDVVKSGILYYKPHKRGSYSQKMFILTANGWVLFYNVYDRDSSKQHCNHQKKGALDLAGCYVYSGLDDSKKRKGSNRDNLLRKSARIYKNGLSTDDDSLSCIFSIWKPSLRRYFSTRKHRLSVYHHDKRTNPYGSTWTFLAPSRREKEEWVCALNTVIEHMIRNESR